MVRVVATGEGLIAELSDLGPLDARPPQRFAGRGDHGERVAAADLDAEVGISRLIWWVREHLALPWIAPGGGGSARI